MIRSILTQAPRRFQRNLVCNNVRCFSGKWSDVPAAPLDPILGMSQRFQADTDPRKVNVSIGAYRTDEGKPLVLNCVKKAEKILVEDNSLNKEYLPQRGDVTYAQLCQQMLFGEDSELVKSGTIATAQTLSGTGALRLGAEFMKRYAPGTAVYISSPTWGTHNSIMDHAGVPYKPYRYWNAEGRDLDLAGMLEDIEAAPEGSVIMLHAAAHNPLKAPPTTHRSEMPRKPIIGGNWKCNPAETAKLEGLIANFKPTAATLDKCDIYVCPSNLHLGMVYDKFESGIMVTPQNCNFKGCGAYTGEMAVDQMVDMGLKCCLIGHSERRGEFGLPTPKETNELLATKLAYILEKGLTCVFCIGEPLPIREKGTDAVLEECVAQLTGIKETLKALEDKSRVVIAYEPVWAIGTGVTASPEQAQETHKAIRDWIKKEVDEKTGDEIRIQYGGSANAKNAPDLSKCPDIDGFLVGGASLKPEFAEIVAAMVAAKCS